MTARRILWVSSKIPFPLLSGDKIRQFNLLRRLAERHAVDLVTFLLRPEDRDFVPALEKICERVWAVPFPDPALLARSLRALDPQRPFHVYRHASALLRKAIGEAIGSRRYDVVEIQHVYMAPYFDALPRRASVRVLTLHNVESVLSARCAAVERNPLRRLFWRLEAARFERFERQWLPLMDAIVVMSELERRLVASVAPSARTFVVENGVDTDEFLPSPSEARDHSVVFTGSLGYAPNADAVAHFLAHVWPAVRQSVPDATFFVVGRDPSPTLRARHGRDGITVTGVVDDVRPYLARAGAVVVPLRAGGGTRLKILEAMAMACPIVSTALGAEGLDVQDGVELLLADEPAAFAHGIVSLLTRPDLRLRLGRAARRRAELRYDWKFAVDAVERLYQLHGPAKEGACAS